MKDESFVEELRSLQADLQIVVAFRMLPEVVWNMPRLGTFNLHASLLPQYRGAAPINWAVINGDTETGITTFFLKHEIDTGEIIQQVRVPIADTDNVGIVHDKLMMLGGELVLETVDAILAGTVKPVPQEKLIQSEAELRPAPKIFKETCRIDWNQGVYEAEKILCQHDMQIGEIRTDLKTDFRIAVKDGFINILSLQLAGKKRMHVADFLRGYRTANDNRVE